MKIARKGDLALVLPGITPGRITGQKVAVLSDPITASYGEIIGEGVYYGKPWLCKMASRTTVSLVECAELNYRWWVGTNRLLPLDNPDAQTTRSSEKERTA